MKNAVVFFLTCALIALIGVSSDDLQESSLFEPTDDWKEVLVGQHIPAVRSVSHT